MHRTLTAVAGTALLTAALNSPSLARPATDEAPDVAAAVMRTLEGDTARFGAEVTMEVPGALPETLLLSATGQLSFGLDPRVWLEAEIAELGSLLAVFDGNDVYFGGAAFEALVPEGHYLYLDLTDPVEGFEELVDDFAFGSDAALSLYWLLGSDGPVEVVGLESEGDVEMVHVAMAIDLEAVRDQVPDDMRSVFEQSLAEIRASGADVDRAEAWLDEDGYLRRVRYDMPFPIEGEPAMLITEYRFDALGEPLELPIPAPEQVVDARSVVGQ